MKTITDAIKNLEASREILFEVSRELMSSENGDFRKAEAFFELAKRAEILRMDAKELSNGKLEAVPMRAEVERVTAAPTKASANAVRGPRKNKGDYPKYVFRNKNLVKIGLSRDARSEYEHTVEHNNLDRILSTLNSYIGKEFAVPDLCDHLAGIPEYQVYVVVARLKELGTIVSLRKGFYEFTPLIQEGITVNHLQLAQ